MTWRRWRKAAVWSAIVVGVLLRVAGAIVNTQANDDHLEVIRVLANERRIPAPDEFWESFQPPLYHMTVAAALIARPSRSPGIDITIAQEISCAAGLLTLFVLIVFIRRLEVSEANADLAIALTSLNPALISTSIQATNDAFVILFVTVGLAAGYEYFRRGGTGAFVVMTAAVLLACVTKGNGLVLAIAVTATFASTLLRPSSPRSRIAGHAAVFAFAFALVVPVAGGYVARHNTMGSAFAISQPPAPPPDFFTEGAEKRPGIKSIVGGFFTFRLVNMLEDPLIQVETERPSGETYPKHRTSMWSLLYGGTHSVHYAYFPPTWQLPPERATWLVRLTLLCALLPTLVLMIGVTRGGIDSVTRAFHATQRNRNADMMLVLAATGHLAFVAVYGYRYRDFATMKAIFVCPAALGFLTWFVRELERPATGAYGFFMKAARASAWLLCLAYAVDVGALIYWLAVRAG